MQVHVWNTAKKISCRVLDSCVRYRRIIVFSRFQISALVFQRFCPSRVIISIIYQILLLGYLEVEFTTK